MSKLTYVLIGTAIAVAIVALAMWPTISETFERPHEARMRAHILSRTTDEQLLKIKADAVVLFEQHRKQQQDLVEKFTRDRAARLRLCETNPAEKLRDPHGCSLLSHPVSFDYIGKPMAGFESPEVIFETELLGICRFIDNVRKAKQSGCLPN